MIGAQFISGLTDMAKSRAHQTYERFTPAWMRTEVDRFSYIHQQASEQAKKKMWWDEVSRQICPDVFQILEDKLQLDEYEVCCIVVGKNQGITEGLPGETLYTFQKKLIRTTLKDCILLISEKQIPISAADANDLVQEAIFYNEGNQANYVKNNDLGIQNESLKNDHEDLVRQGKVLHENKETMFHTAYIVTIWALDEKTMIKAKSHVKGVMREHKILGEIPLKKMHEAFLTGQPYPYVDDDFVIEMFSDMAAILSPTINPFSSLSGNGDGIYFGHETETGKDLALDFWSEPAPHVLMIGATGSGKTYALILLMIRLYLEGRKVIYLTKKRDKDTNYRAVCEYFGENGNYSEVGRGLKMFNPWQILWDDSFEHISEEEATEVFDMQIDIGSNFLRTYFKDDYSSNMDGVISQTMVELCQSKEFGIKRNDPKTWKDKRFPMMDEWIQKLENDLKNIKGRRKQTYQSLIDKTIKFRMGQAFDFINCQTNVDFSKRFQVIDIVKVPKGLKEPMNVLITSIISSQVSSNSEKGLSIFIDEGGSFLKERDLAEQLFEGLTQWRSQNTQLIFATHQLDDLKDANMSAVFMSNCFFKLIFGANMDESVVPYVQSFMHLKQQHVGDLMELKKGECLVKIRNRYVKCEVTADDLSHAIVKNLRKTQIKEEAQEASEEKTESELVKIKPMYEHLAINKELLTEEGITQGYQAFFESWIDGQYSQAELIQAGYKKHNLQNALDMGTVNIWIHESLMRGKRVLNQTPDHFCTCLQIAAYLIQLGFKKVMVHNRNNVDVEAEYNGKTYAFEFEKDISHTKDEIGEKFRKAKALFDFVYIISTSSNTQKCIEAVEEDPKTKEPVNTKPRGPQTKDLIDSLILKPAEMQAESTEQKEPEQKEELTEKDNVELEEIMKDIALITEDDLIGQSLYDTIISVVPEGSFPEMSAAAMKIYKRKLAIRQREQNPAEYNLMYTDAKKLLQKIYG